MAEREWREASDLRVPAAGLAVVLGVAAVLRFWALDHGIPFAVQVDEPEIMNRAVQMMKTGDFNPHFFDYPGLTIYLHLVVATVRFMAGAMDGLWRSLESAGPADFYTWGRALTATFGAATVFVTFRIGLRWGARHGLLAAGLLAVMPLHVRESHYVLTDVPMTFFVALAMLLSLRANEKAALGAFAWAGAVAGLAAAAKYNGGLALLFPLLAAWMTLEAKPSRLLCALAALAASAGAFLLAAPYTILDLPAFLDAFAYLATHYRPPPPGAEPGAVVYLKHLRNAMGWPALILVFAGLVMGVVRAIKGPGRLRWTLAVVFPVVYFFLISGRQPIYGRYLLPIVPFACVLAAAAVVSGVSLLRRFDIPRAPRRALITTLTVLALISPAVQSVEFNRRVAKPSTQALAYEWITQHVPRGSVVIVEKFDLRLPPERYRSDHVVSLTQKDFETYAAEGVQYFVASSQVYGPFFEAPHQDPERYAAYRRLFDQAIERAVISPSDEHPGPELRIYEMP